MSTLAWYEGQVTAIREPDLGSQTRSCTAWVVSEGYTISNIQLPLVVSNQTKVGIGDKIVFYRDSSASARYAFSISDPTPIGQLNGTVSQPISIETAGLALQTGEDNFESGEWAASARGSSAAALPTSGAFIWLKNNGDGFLCSGSYNNKIEVSDSTGSTDITGTTLDIYAQGNLIYTQAINFAQDLLGNITLNMGQRNPTTGVFLSSLSCGFDGSWVMSDLLTLSGIFYNPVPSLPLGPFDTPQIQLTSIPLESTLTINPLGTTILGPSISLDALESSVTVTEEGTAILGPVLEFTAAPLESFMTINLEGVTIAGPIVYIESPLISIGNGALSLADVLKELIVAIRGIITVGGPTTQAISPASQAALNAISVQLETLFI